MSEENKTRDVIDAITGVAKAIPVYQDAVQPAAQELGKALQTVAKTVHIALAPVSALVWGYDQIKEFVSTKVSERLKGVPPENIVSPKPNVAGPALEALRYTGHESELSDMYANLLATSMDRATLEGAHPAFVEIIKQLTPDEAKLLALLGRDVPMPLLSIRWEFKPNEEGQTGGKAVLTHFSHLGKLAGCEFPSLTPAYIDNLCRLGLAQVPAFFQYTSKGIYEPLESDPAVLAITTAIEKNEKLVVAKERKGMQVTQLGAQFIQTCVRKKGGGG